MWVRFVVVLAAFACRTPAPVPVDVEPAEDAPDELVLRDDQRIVGTVMFENEDHVLLGQRSGTFVVPRGDVREIRRRSAGAAKQVEAKSERFPAFHTMLAVIARQPWVKDLRQVPATVVDTGELRNIPYISHKAGSIEFNVYGDPDHPAGVEIGIYEASPDEATRTQLRTFMVDLFPSAADKAAIQGLGLDDDSRQQDGLTFDVDPPSAQGAYGGWWLTIYDGGALDRARASAEELKTVTSSSDDTYRSRRAKSSTSRSIYVRGYVRKNGMYTRPARRRR